MNLIVSVTENWGIGCGNKLLLSIPEDMKRFREITQEAVLVMGRATLESLPGGKPLKGRVNIVMSARQGFQVEGALMVSSVQELLGELENYESSRVFVIGGEQIYRLLLPYCQYAYLTKMGFTAPDADAFFPNLDEDPEWEIDREEPKREHEGVQYAFVRYRRVTPMM